MRSLETKEIRGTGLYKTTGAIWAKVNFDNPDEKKLRFGFAKLMVVGESKR